MYCIVGERSDGMGFHREDVQVVALTDSEEDANEVADGLQLLGYNTTVCELEEESEENKND